MNRTIYLVIACLSLLIVVTIFWSFSQERQLRITGTTPIARPQNPTPTSIPSVSFVTPPVRYSLAQSQFVSQSFNNCGPASLSMVMSMFGKHVDQETLADRMRPFHNPFGGNDDKSVFAEEFVTYAKEYGFEALERPNGDIDLLKKLVANDIPVVVRTWLHPNEDIGHFRIVRGYDEEKKTLLQDDSYQGPNLTYSYEEFLAMWQPFNYGYILVYPPEKQAVVQAILGDQMDARTAYTKSIARATSELGNCHPEQREGSLDSSSSTQNDTNCSYSLFNISSASYYLGDYGAAVSNYEKALPGLPGRMLWYQIEPIQAYAKIGAAPTVFSLTDAILNNGNLAYSELYQIRGEMYRSEGKSQAAKAEFEKAVLYNENYEPAKEALKTL